jgi:tRNA1(Val) A37 N6-methylase TrmN6
MADTFSSDALRPNDFLGGRLSLLQPLKGYRAGIDPVLLAASIPAKPAETVLDLGCGGGVAMLCVAARVGCPVIGVERQAPYAALARQNADRNGLPATVYTADLSQLPPDLKQRQIHHVLANPPYFDASARTPADDEGREAGLAEDTPLATWVKTSAARVRPGGTVTFVHRAEAAPRLLALFSEYLGSVQLLPLIPRAGRDARLILIRGRKNGKAPFRLHSPLVLHAKASHERDEDDYSAEISAILRDANPLDFPK